MARSLFLRKVLEAAMAYVTETAISTAEIEQVNLKGTINKRLPDFSKGYGCDQTMFRLLHPRFYPRLKLDYRGRLALR